MSTAGDEIRRAHFGRKSERISEDRLALALEDLEAALARDEAKDEKADPALRLVRTHKRRTSRVIKFDHLPHEEVVIEPESKICPCCGGALHVIGEDTSRRLDKIPAKIRLIVMRRPKYACRTCTDGVVQAPAAPCLIEGGLPAEAFVADVILSKFADHQPLYRQSQVLARHDVPIERSTLAQWVGLEALYNHLVRSLKSSPKLFADETRCPVLDPGRGKTKSGYLWAIARDDRPWGGTAPPAIAYSYAPGWGGEHAIALVEGFAGVLQVDGYAVHKQLAAEKGLGAVTLAFCWAHVRRKFYDIFERGNAPIATEALVRIRQLYAIEPEMRGGAPRWITATGPSFDSLMIDDSLISIVANAGNHVVPHSVLHQRARISATQKLTRRCVGRGRPTSHCFKHANRKCKIGQGKCIYRLNHRPRPALSVRIHPECCGPVEEELRK